MCPWLRFRHVYRVPCANDHKLVLSKIRLANYPPLLSFALESPFVRSKEIGAWEYTGPIDETGAPHGFGSFTISTKFKCPGKFTGNFMHGKRHGMGSWVSSDSTRVEGEFFSDKMHGRILRRSLDNVSQLTNFIRGRPVRVTFGLQTQSEWLYICPFNQTFQFQEPMKFQCLRWILVC